MPQSRGKEPSVHTLLLDIYERMGKIEAQSEQILREQASARDARSTILQNQSFISQRMDDFDGGEAARYEGGFKTGLRDLTSLKKQLAIAGVMVFGAFQIIWFGVIYIKQIFGFIWDAISFWGHR